MNIVWEAKPVICGVSNYGEMSRFPYVVVVKTWGQNPKETTKPKMTLTLAHHGIIIGEPIYDIWFQSKVKRPMPKPVTVPKS